MQEKTMKINELAEIVNMNARTLRDYLTNYRFNKFKFYIKEDNHKYLTYKVNPDFANNMARILYLRRKWGAVKLWGDYCGENYLNILDKEYEDV